MEDTEHRFYKEVVMNAMQTAILDFFDFHARIHCDSDISTQSASIMNRFLRMLEEGTYRKHRDKSLSFVDISDIFGFSSPAYFSRYVQQNLGMKPSDYRD